MKTTLQEQDLRADAGQYLIFALAHEHYGLDILKVREIVAMMDITSVPRMPAYVIGVVNLRGKVVPVMDLRLLLGMPEVQRTPRTCIVVVHAAEVETGIVVDRVLEVSNLPADCIEETPCFGANVDAECIRGLAKTEHGVTILLDIERVLDKGTAIRLTETRAFQDLECFDRQSPQVG